MTRKDYNMFASVLSKALDNTECEEATRAIWNISFELAKIFEKDNPRFDLNKWICVISGDTK